MTEIRLTYDSENAEDVWCEDDEHVDQGEEGKGDDDMTDPAECLIGEDHLLNGPAYLVCVRNHKRRHKSKDGEQYTSCFRTFIHCWKGNTLSVLEFPEVKQPPPPPGVFGR